MTSPAPKRSKTAALFILGASAFALAGCQEEQTQASAFPDEASCRAQASEGGWFTEKDCTDAFAQAQVLHDETAPRYDSKELCETEHGPEACVQDGGSGGGGGIFLPIMTGYLLGQALGGGRVMSQPVIRTPDGFSTPNGNTRLNAVNGSGTLSAQTFEKAAVTKGQAPMSRATVQQRGGFGQSGGARTGG